MSLRTYAQHGGGIVHTYKLMNYTLMDVKD